MAKTCTKCGKTLGFFANMEEIDDELYCLSCAEEVQLQKEQNAQQESSALLSPEESQSVIIHTLRAINATLEKQTAVLKSINTAIMILFVLFIVGLIIQSCTPF